MSEAKELVMKMMDYSLSFKAIKQEVTRYNYEITTNKHYFPSRDIAMTFINKVLDMKETYGQVF